MDRGTMAGMTDEHLIASVDPQTDLEKELHKRLCEATVDNEYAEVANRFGIDSSDLLSSYLNQPECPSKDWLDGVLDDAAYLMDYPSKSGARDLYDKLRRLQGELI